LIFDKNQLRAILVDEEQVADYEADLIIERLEKVDHPHLQQCLDQWLQNRIVLDATLENIMEKKKRNFCSALLTLSVFMDHPEKMEEILSVPTIKRKKHPFGRGG
jgi:hypothetical protein